MIFLSSCYIIELTLNVKEKAMQEKVKARIMDAEAVCRAIRRLSHEITERNKGTDGVVIVGILKRGASLAQRIADEIFKIEGERVPVGHIDVTYYRDDLSIQNIQPVVNSTSIPFDINERHVILVDDVIYTGRTVRAAIDGLFRKGRPRTVQLAVLVDRGLRELPFKPDYVGKNIPTSHQESVCVSTDEEDGCDSVVIIEK